MVVDVLDVLSRGRFADHPTQRVAAPDGAAFVVEVKPASRARRARSVARTAQHGWTVEVTAPSVDGYERLVVDHHFRSRTAARRRARAIQRRIRRGELH